MRMPTAPTIEVPHLDTLGRASDAELLEAVREWNACVRSAQSVVAAFAAEIDRRSRRDLGYEGLAQRSGARTPELLVSQLTGTSMREARDLVAVGRVLDATPVWLEHVATGVAVGSLSVGAAAAITTGLGAPSGGVAADDLLDAARQLVVEAPGLSADQVARRARELRDDLDADGVAEREAALRDKRSLRWAKTADGLTRMTAFLDPESAAFVVPAFDAITSPRRGGPRFVDPDQAARDQALLDDPRTTEQIALDGFVDLIRIAVTADPGHVYGIRKPAVRILVNERDLRDGTGAAHADGEHTALSTTTADRLACAHGYRPLLSRIDGTIDVGRSQRLFTDRQKEALATLWGGCAFPHCERPPSWTEAHHIVSWLRGGPTDISNGILLCRHHHFLIHHTPWRIEPPPNPDEPWLLHPPKDQGRQPLELVPKNPVYRRARPRDR